MRKIIVVYYSNTGNNKYLAEKIAQDLNCEIEAIKPRINAFPLLLLSSMTKISAGIRALRHDLNEYDRIILCGPVWIGEFISPLRSFVKMYMDSINSLYFITCCGCSDAEKDSKFGYAKVFSKIKALVNNKISHCEAFPINLVVPENKSDNNKAIMNTRLSDQNFNGDILERYNEFIKIVSS